MRRYLKWGLRLLVVVALVAAGLAAWKREEITRLMAVNSLFAEEKIVNNFSAMDTMFLTRALSRGDGPVSALPVGVAAILPSGVEDWINERMVTGLVVLKDGKIVAETYFHDTEADDLRISWSMAKSWISALFGIVLEEGAIASLDDPVTKYAPSLKGSAYDTATVRNVLNMASGVAFDEDYLDYDSDINRMGRVLALGGSMDEFTAGLVDRNGEAGDSWHYVSIDTHVIGMVLRGATGRDIPTLLEEKLLMPMGLQAAPYYITDGHGVAFVLGGLNMTTRDYARLGQMYLQDGRWNGRQIVPADWVRASTVASAPTDAGATQYGYQWWLPADARDGEFFARGIYGQYIYVNRPLGVVIAVNAADRKFREPGVNDQNIAMFRRIAESL